MHPARVFSPTFPKPDEQDLPPPGFLIGMQQFLLNPEAFSLMKGKSFPFGETCRCGHCCAKFPDVPGATGIMATANTGFVSTAILVRRLL
jgi:hypothetical protein